MSLLEHTCWVDSRETPEQRRDYYDMLAATATERVTLAPASSASSQESSSPKLKTAEERLQDMFRGTGVLVSPTQEGQTFIIPEQKPNLPAMRVRAQLAQLVSHQMRNELLAAGKSV